MKTTETSNSQKSLDELSDAELLEKGWRRVTLNPDTSKYGRSLVTKDGRFYVKVGELHPKSIKERIYGNGRIYEWMLVLFIIILIDVIRTWVN